MAVTINIDSQIVVQTAAQWAADSTVYSAQRILITSDEVYTGTDQRKFKIANGTDTWANLDYLPIGGAVWGGITGTLSDQTDLDTELATKITTNTDATVKSLSIAGVSGAGYMQLRRQTFVSPAATANYFALYCDQSGYLSADYNASAFTWKLDHSLLTQLRAFKFPDTDGTFAVGTGTANELPYWVNANTLGTLPVATYPSLTELSYVKGVTSAVQTQLNGKEPTITTLSISKGGTNSGTALTNNKVMISSGGSIVEADTTTYPSVTELSYVKGVTSAIQTQLNGKQATLTNPVTGTGTNNEIAAFNGTSTITSLSTATYPSLTELSYVKGVTSAIQTQTNTIVSQYQEILQGGVFISTAASGSYWISTQQNSNASVPGTASATPPAMIHIVSTDYPSISGKTAKLRVRVILACNDVAPARNFTIGLYPVTRPATSGGSGTLAYTQGTVVTGSTVTITTPAADSLNTAATSDFDFPADGVYALAVDLSGATAANSSEHIQVSLQVHWV